MSKAVKQSSLMTALLPSFILYTSTIILVALTRGDLGATVKYWEFMVPLTAVISLISGWGVAYSRNASRFTYLIKQILHWGVLMGLLWLLQTQGIATALSGKYTLVLLYLLSMTVIFAAFYLDTKQLFFGAFLAFCAYLMAAPANVAILKPIGEMLRIADAQSQPLTMIAVVGLIAFALNAVFVMGTRSAVIAKRARLAAA
ncbi:hypothetical protein CKO12_06845 [Chromatium okenii]|uniref:hypothetical protein n=1 Tax=Chromatium okenii TaxID=61644 RepID=UPI0019039951|nr:hypothetical protein [Chromatium okenii]